MTLYTALPYLRAVYSVVETPTFARLAARFWDDESLTAFIDYIASNPEAGDVVPGAGGLRKIRWGSASQGKRGGVRVIYFNRLASGEIWLLLVYPKSARDNVSPQLLRQIKKEIEDA